MDICATVCLKTLQAVTNPDPDVRSRGMLQCRIVYRYTRPDRRDHDSPPMV